MKTDFLSSLLFSISVTLPTILLLALGIYLRNKKMIDDKFCEQATKVVFNVTLPVLLFFSVYGKNIDYHSQLKILSVGIIGTTLLFILAEIFAAKFIIEKRERGIFVQAIYRGNNGILGLAFCIAAFGESATAPASIYSAAVIFLYNILAVITLTRSLATGKVSIPLILKGIIKNPLIIGIVLALIANSMSLELPKPLLSTGHYLANVTLPLALICAGATINFSVFSNKTSQVVLLGSFGRLFITPIFMVIVAKCFGLDGMLLGVVALMNTTPVASAMYAMVRGMGGNATIAANIIGITTVGSMITTSLIILVLSQIGWI
ncbi:AEC family transporter [Mannheimia massilioguelmaensis]|uniref:AEC family transporter n=1 Tax=Mannheimia massilioguelmaensis TaxID=1604354 RepID=UPI0005C88331|nr:AEC family transporter [Mannheimia massilioguelmaensis]